MSTPIHHLISAKTIAPIVISRNKLLDSKTPYYNPILGHKKEKKIEQLGNMIRQKFYI